MAQYLQKGSPVFIEGKLRLDQWQDQQGNNRSKLKVVVDDFQFVGGGQGGDGPRGGQRGSGQSGGGHQENYNQAPQPAGGQDDYPPISDDDIPF